MKWPEAKFGSSSLNIF